MAYLLSHTLSVRLSEDDTITGRSRSLQVAVNDAMRMLAGVDRRDRVKLADLQGDVNMPTVNYVVARQAAMAAWHAMASPSGSSLSSIITDLKPDSRTRGASDGLLRMPKDPRNIHVGNMVKIWNAFPALGAAKTASMARLFIRKKLRESLPV